MRWNLHSSLHPCVPFTLLCYVCSFFISQKECVRVCHKREEKIKENNGKKGSQRERGTGKSSGDVVKIMNNLTLITFALWRCVAGVWRLPFTQTPTCTSESNQPKIHLNTIQHSIFIEKCVCSQISNCLHGTKVLNNNAAVALTWFSVVFLFRRLSLYFSLGL